MAEEEKIEEVEENEDAEIVEDEVVDSETSEDDVDSPKGWKTKEQWEAEGNDPADYVGSKEVWREKGRWIRKSAKQKRDHDHQIGLLRSEFDQRLKNQENLSAIGLKNAISALQGKLEDAIDRGDKEEAKDIQEEINANRDVANSIKDQPSQQPTAPQVSEEQAEWQDNNDWIYGKSPKAVYAKSIMGDLRAGTSSETEAFQRLDEELEKEFPQTNPRRKQPRQAEGGSSPGRPKAGALTERDLTPEDKSYIRDFGPTVAPDGKGGTDMKEMLKMVEQSRA